MKKCLTAIFALAVATTVATAGVGINWNIQFGAYHHDAGNLSEYPSANNLLGPYGPYNAIWQLIYAGTDNLANPIPAGEIPVAGGLNGDYVYGDDVVWGQREIANNGGPAGDGTAWDEWMLWDGMTGNPSYEDAAWATAGFVYQRVFETATFGAVANGDYYYESSLLALNTAWGVGLPAQDFYLDTASAGFKPDTQITAIPEPATMGLLGLGALVMAIRRRRS